MPLNTSNMYYDNAEIRMAGIKQDLLMRRRKRWETYKAILVQNAANAEKQRIAAGLAQPAPGPSPPPLAAPLPSPPPAGATTFAAVSADTRDVRIREITAEINRLATELTSLT